MKQNKKTFLFVVIFLLAFFLRFQNVNWDANMHLHPDERFLTMVGNAMRLPSNLGEYLNAVTSTWNPTNIGFPFFVYGLFPLTLNKIIALLFSTDSYNVFTIQGRILSGFADLVALLFVYKLGLLLRKKYNLSQYFPIFSAFLYAIAVYPIQSAHFFTTDTFLNTFLIISVYTSLIYYFESKLQSFILSSLFLGFAISSKISAVYMAPVILLIVVGGLVIKKKGLSDMLMQLFLFVIVLYGTIRFASPYYFETGDIFNPGVNKQFIKSITELQLMASGKMLFPPAVQWYSKTPVLFSLFNLSFIALGILSFALSLSGVLFVFRICISELKQKKSKHKMDSFLGMCILLWGVAYFLYNSLQFAQSIRYLIFLFPILTLLGGYALTLIQRNKRAFVPFLIIGLLIWPFLFTSIYLFQNTRIQASWWIYKNIPDGSFLLSEYWDDSLPYPVSAEKKFRIEQMNVFDPDTNEKWKKMNAQLQNADYYILSSNRGWASIPTVPDKYPKMSVFYIDLFNGKTNYSLIKRFIPFYQHSFPFHPQSWLNNWFEEAFTVYDHPSVFIFKKENK